MPDRPKFALRMLLPGLLVAATGVGAGDLLTAGFAGSKLGLAILWAAFFGALMKWVLNEGLARWQLATGTTLLEGWMTKLSGWVKWAFLAYLLLWSFSVGGALIGACGVAGHALCPIVQPADPADEEQVLAAARQDKIVWGIAHSLAGLALVWLGGFKLFEALMACCIGVMVVTVLATAVLLGPDWGAVFSGAILPRIPPDESGSFTTSIGWIVGVIGGVGGTVTLLSYGYWIREEGRTGEDGVRVCRIDLAAGYALTALFGAAMIVIGSHVPLAEKGPTVAVVLADEVARAIGPYGRWIFLLGFWGAVFSSLLGVWQGVPYLFADFLLLRRGESAQAIGREKLTRTGAYRGFLIALALVPCATLWIKVVQVQFIYAVLGALFMPALALSLLIMNNRAAWVGERFRNGRLINAALVLTLLFFAYVGWTELPSVSGLIKALYH